MFLKIKNNKFAIKVRGCTDGRKQQNFIYKEVK